MRFPHKLIVTGLLAILIISTICPSATAQRDIRHFRHAADMPPGTVGRDQLRQGGPLRGYFQPVQIIGPPGSSVSFVAAGQFQPAEKSPVTVGMLIGEVYRFKISGIPGYAGMEVFPTLELINRLYPPHGQKVRFPIPIQLTTEELGLALGGQLVTRVIYLEDPAIAFPYQDDPQLQRYFDVGLRQDPLHVADELGRPMAILRLGSRTPDTDTSVDGFSYGSPPLVRFQRVLESLPVVGELKTVTPNRAAARSASLAPAAPDPTERPTESAQRVLSEQP